MKLRYLRQSCCFLEDYDRVQKVKFILLEDKDFQKLLREAFSPLFLAKYPEFDQDIISIIIARLQIILNDQIEAGLGTKLDPKDIKEIIYQELIERGIKETRANMLVADDLVMKNFIQGFYGRPEWTDIEKKVRSMTNKEEFVPKIPLKRKQINLTKDPFKF